MITFFYNNQVKLKYNIAKSSDTCKYSETSKLTN